MTIFPGIPDPRCTIVSASQMLKVVNKTLDTIEVSPRNFEASIAPESEHTFTVPFGEYLGFGVHYLETSTCCAGAIWLKETP